MNTQKQANVDNRRSFLQKTAATGLALALPASSFSGFSESASAEEKTVPEKKLPLIDAHSHIWGRDLKKYPLAHDLSLKDLKPASFTPEELFAQCEPHGVGRVVLIQHTIYHRFDNSYITDAVAKYPGRFSAVAVIDDHGSDPAAEVIAQKKKGVRGFRIVPRDWHGDQSDLPPEKWLAGTGMRSMWKTAGENGLAMCPLIHPHYIPSVRKMCEFFPDTNVVIDHFGRIGIDGTIRERDLKELCGLARHPQVHVKISAYYALGKKRPPYKDLIPMIRRVLDAFGPERCMWASDAPYQVVDPHTYTASINLVKNDLDILSDADRDWLLRGTAEKVFFA